MSDRGTPPPVQGGTAEEPRGPAGGDAADDGDELPDDAYPGVGAGPGDPMAGDGALSFDAEELPLDSDGPPGGGDHSDEPAPPPMVAEAVQGEGARGEGAGPAGLPPDAPAAQGRAAPDDAPEKRKASGSLEEEELASKRLREVFQTVVRQPPGPAGPPLPDLSAASGEEEEEYFGPQGASASDTDGSEGDAEPAPNPYMAHDAQRAPEMEIRGRHRGETPEIGLGGGGHVYPSYPSSPVGRQRPSSPGLTVKWDRETAGSPDVAAAPHRPASPAPHPPAGPPAPAAQLPKRRAPARRMRRKMTLEEAMMNEMPDPGELGWVVFQEDDSRIRILRCRVVKVHDHLERAEVVDAEGDHYHVDWDGVFVKKEAAVRYRDMVREERKRNAYGTSMPTQPAARPRSKPAARAAVSKPKGRPRGPPDANPPSGFGMPPAEFGLMPDHAHPGMGETGWVVYQDSDDEIKQAAIKVTDMHHREEKLLVDKLDGSGEQFWVHWNGVFILKKEADQFYRQQKLLRPSAKRTPKRPRTKPPAKPSPKLSAAADPYALAFENVPAPKPAAKRRAKPAPGTAAAARARPAKAPAKPRAPRRPAKAAARPAPDVWTAHFDSNSELDSGSSDAAHPAAGFHGLQEAQRKRPHWESSSEEEETQDAAKELTGTLLTLHQASPAQPAVQHGSSASSTVKAAADVDPSGAGPGSGGGAPRPATEGASASAAATPVKVLVDVAVGTGSDDEFLLAPPAPPLTTPAVHATSDAGTSATPPPEGPTEDAGEPPPTEEDVAALVTAASPSPAPSGGSPAKREEDLDAWAADVVAELTEEQRREGPRPPPPPAAPAVRGSSPRPRPTPAAIRGPAAGDDSEAEEGRSSAGAEAGSDRDAQSDFGAAEAVGRGGEDPSDPPPSYHAPDASSSNVDELSLGQEQADDVPRGTRRGRPPGPTHQSPQRPNDRTLRSRNPARPQDYHDDPDPDPDPGPEPPTRRGGGCRWAPPSPPRPTAGGNGGKGGRGEPPERPSPPAPNRRSPRGPRSPELRWDAGQWGRPQDDPAPRQPSPLPAEVMVWAAEAEARAPSPGPGPAPTPVAANPTNAPPERRVVLDSRFDGLAIRAGRSSWQGGPRDRSPQIEKFEREAEDRHRAGGGPRAAPDEARRGGGRGEEGRRAAAVAGTDSPPRVLRSAHRSDSPLAPFRPRGHPPAPPPPRRDGGRGGDGDRWQPRREGRRSRSPPPRWESGRPGGRPWVRPERYESRWPARERKDGRDGEDRGYRPREGSSHPRDRWRQQHRPPSRDRHHPRSPSPDRKRKRSRSAERPVHKDQPTDDAPRLTPTSGEPRPATDATGRVLFRFRDPQAGPAERKPHAAPRWSTPAEGTADGSQNVGRDPGPKRRALPK